MKIIKDVPPNFEDIVKVFPMAADTDNVIFAYDNAIYNPSGADLSKHLIAHEKKHCDRQNICFVGGIVTSTDSESKSLEWWHHYLNNLEFRYHEELLAHRAEYQSMIQTAINRNQRRDSLKKVSKKLSHRLYGGMTTKRQAAIDILEQM